MPQANSVLTVPERGSIAIAPCALPQVRPGFVLVEIEIAPVCAEHRAFHDEQFGWQEDRRHLGHEGVGTVQQAGVESSFVPGDRVIVYKGQTCGRCFVCRQGLSPAHCLRLNNAPQSIARGHGDAGFSRFRLVQEGMLQTIPPSLSFRHAATANCSVGCTYTAFEELGVSPGDWVVVAGIGAIGLGAIINARFRGARVIALGRSAERMALARALGAEQVIDPDSPGWHQRLKQLTASTDGCDVAVECSGSPYYQKKCLTAVRQYGSVYLAGCCQLDQTTLPLHAHGELQNRHVRLAGGHDVRIKDRIGLVRMLEHPDVRVALDQLITHEFDMSDAAAAFHARADKRSGKVFLYPKDNAPKNT